MIMFVEVPANAYRINNRKKVRGIGIKNGLFNLLMKLDTGNKSKLEVLKCSIRFNGVKFKKL